MPTVDKYHVVWNEVAEEYQARHVNWFKPSSFDVKIDDLGDIWLSNRLSFVCNVVVDEIEGYAAARQAIRSGKYPRKGPIAVLLGW